MTRSERVVEAVARAIVAEFERASPIDAERINMDWRVWIPEAIAAIAAYEATKHTEFL